MYTLKDHAGYKLKDSIPTIIEWYSDFSAIFPDFRQLEPDIRQILETVLRQLFESDIRQFFELDSRQFFELDSRQSLNQILANFPNRIFVVF